MVAAVAPTERVRRRPRSQRHVPSGLTAGGISYWPPQAVSPIAKVIGFIDTIQVLLRSTSPHDRKRIQDAHDRSDWFYKEVKVDDRIIGYHAKLQMPQPDVLYELHSMLQEYRGYDNDEQGSITRLDYAFDFIPLGGRTREDIDRWLLAHLIVPYRRAGPIFTYENTTYFAKNANKRQNSRDAVLYSDKASKLSLLDGAPITHLDIRLRGRQILEADGIVTVRDAMRENPASVLFNNLYFTDTDIEPHALSWAKASLTSASFDDKEQRDAFIHREQLYSAQRVKERLHVPMPRDIAPPLIVGSRLRWLPRQSQSGRW